MRSSPSPPRCLRIVAPQVPCVKFQSAYFEKYLWEGVEAYYSLIAEAAELGLLVIGDVKRGDIGSTAAAYAAAHLADASRSTSSEDVIMPDAITVNPMLRPGHARAVRARPPSEYDKGLFVLVRTSNPGSAELQDVKLADGRTWSEMLADKLARIAADDRRWSGPAASARIGAVVGATQPHTMQSLRRRAAAVDLPAARLRRARRDGGDDPGRVSRRAKARSSRRAEASCTPIGRRNTPSSSATIGRGASSRRCWI